ATEDGVWLWELATGRLRSHGKGMATLLACSLDARAVAASLGSVVRLLDLRTGKEFGRLTGHQAEVQALAYTRDGKALVSGSADSTALVWDATRLTPPPPKVEEQGARRLDELWADLGGDDAAKAFLAANVLAASPKGAVSLLAERLKPAPAPDA